MDIKPNTVGFARDVGELNQTKFKPNPPYSFGSLVVIYNSVSIQTHPLDWPAIQPRKIHCSRLFDSSAESGNLSELCVG